MAKRVSRKVSTFSYWVISKVSKITNKIENPGHEGPKMLESLTAQYSWTDPSLACDEVLEVKKEGLSRRTFIRNTGAGRAAVRANPEPKSVQFLGRRKGLGDQHGSVTGKMHCLYENESPSSRICLWHGFWHMSMARDSRDTVDVSPEDTPSIHHIGLPGCSVVTRKKCQISFLFVMTWESVVLLQWVLLIVEV